jgi:hypothetical protein
MENIIRTSILTLLFFIPMLIFGQVTVTVDLSKDTHLISPYLYGRNNSLSGNPGSGFTPEWTRLKDAGVRFFRESGGNNSTKYNWRRKISSHPDWYNNVYANDWSYAAQSLQQNIPDAQGMWAFQLLGKAAMTNAANFNDWGYNNSKWWEGVNQNLAGGGEPKTSGGSKALKEGNINLYLENWTADSTTAILDHWFNNLSLNKSKLQYWSMDNEAEIWNGTHDDVMPTQITAEQFMQRYFEVAKKARQQYPEIKLAGPVTANEWQWYNWPNTISSGGKTYPWLEYFIKRVAEEQTASGVRLLDVLDIHFYPGSTNAADVVQYHRVYFDKTYVYPEANGVKNITGSWDNSQTKEYIFERCKAWLDQYMGTGHGVTFGVTETGIANINTNTTAVWYASTLGEFMKHPEMEIFSPWMWSTGMWEVLHLYSRYNKTSFVPATSDDEEFVSAYPTVNGAGDSLSVVLVNRSVSQTKSVNLKINGFDLDEQPFNTLKLSNLSATETFESHTKNALQKSTVTKSGNSISLSLSPLSITTVLLKGQKGEIVTGTENAIQDKKMFNVYPNPSTNSRITIEIHQAGDAIVDLIDVSGRIVKTIYSGKTSSSFKKEIDIVESFKGTYIFRLNVDGKIVHRKVFTF